MEVVRELERYIGEVLGIEADARVWEKAGSLPFFLRDAYDFFLFHLHGQEFLLMIDVREEEASPATVRKHAEQLKQSWDGDAIYVREQVTSYNRNRLIQNKVPFIVPKNQLYLPMLAMDLREHFVAKRTQVKKLSPAAHMLVLHSIYKHRPLFGKVMKMTDWGDELGYTKMTMSRAFRELRSILGEEITNEIGGRGLWDRVLPYMRSPVLRCHYYDLDVFGPDTIVGGDSALGIYTMMGEPVAQTYCMDGDTWNEKYADASYKVPRADFRTTTVQIWRYDPTRFAVNSVADPLSLYLSFEKNTDERVEIALEELLESVEW